MRLNQIPGNKPDKVSVGFKNADSVTIKAGQPISMVVNGTDDGIACVLPSAAAQKAFSAMFGVCLADVAANANGEAQVFGFCNNLMLMRQTRAASTDTWNTQASITDVLALRINTDANAFNTSGGSQAVSVQLPFAFLVQTLASFASSASATSDTRTAITASVKAFLRMM